MSAIPADLRLPSPWRTALPAFVLLLLAILLLYRETATVMVGIWQRSETFAHAFLVPPISLWLVWRRRRQLAALTPRAQPWLLVPLLVLAGIWLLADLMLVNAAAQYALVAMLVLAVPAALGLEVALAILFPLLFLFFAVPFGEFMVPTMIDWTADFVISALRVTGIPVYREGNNFVIPSGNWSVIDECSGIRYLMASVMVGTLFAYLNYRSMLRRVVFIAASVAVPIVANWLRAYIIVMLGHLSGNRIATGVDHILYGWVFFGVVIFLMFMVGSRWSQPDEADPAEVPAGAARPVGAVPNSSRSLLITVLIGAAIASLPHLTLGVLQRAEGQAAAASVTLPDRLAEGWSADGARIVAWAPKFLTPAAAAERAYAGPAGTVAVYLAYYRGQSDDSKLVSGNNVLLAMRESDWTQVASGSREITVGQQAIRVRAAELLARQASESMRRSHLVVWRFYWIDGRFVGSDVAAKIAGGLARLRGHGDEGAALVLYADGDTVAASNAALEAFVKANLDSLDALLQRTRDNR